MLSPAASALALSSAKFMPYWYSPSGWWTLTRLPAEISLTSKKNIDRTNLTKIPVLIISDISLEAKLKQAQAY
jgi:hypothetical protein